MNRYLTIAALTAVISAGGWFVANEAPQQAAWAQSSAGEFPESWYYNNRPAKLKAMEGKPAPAFSGKNWIGKQQSLAELKGKVVVVDFWATWCGPCVRSIPHNVDLVKKFEKQGLVFIGIHDANRGADKMPAMAKEKKINYPLCVDDGGKSAKAYNVSFFPTYVVIDRNGVVRAAGLTPNNVDAVVKKLLDEKPKA